MEVTQMFSTSPKVRKEKIQIDNISQKYLVNIVFKKIIGEMNSRCFYSKKHKLCLIKMN